MPRPARLPHDQQVKEIIKIATQHLEDHTFEQFRLVTLAKSLGMSHSNIYRFFKSKEDVFDAVISVWLKESRELILQASESDQPPLTRLRNMLIALHESARTKLSQDPNGFALYEHLWNQQSAAANAHKQFIIERGIALLSEASNLGEIVTSDPIKAALLIQAATAKFHTPALIRDALHEDTIAQLDAVLNALWFNLRNDPNCLDQL